MKRLLLPVASLSLVAAGFGAGVAVSATAADDTTAKGAAAEPVTVSRVPLAEAPGPSGAPKRTLGLARVVVMPGAELASHYHPGTQLGYVDEGVLTYTVETGHAQLMKGPGDKPTLVKRIGPGETVHVKPGQWLVEEQGAVHHARNRGDVPVLIYISSLGRTGAPAAIPD